MGHGQNSIPVIARSEATTRLRLLRKLRRAGSPPKLGERRREQSIARTRIDGLLRFRLRQGFGGQVAGNDGETCALIPAARFARVVASRCSLWVRGRRESRA